MNLKPEVLLHYSPKSGIFGDPIPFYWKGEYHLFYQNSPGVFSFNTMRWAHIVSKDLLHWELLPDALIPEPASPDAYGCWTGSVIHWNNSFHIFYTGCAEPDGGRQTICHAISKDLISWQKDPQNPIVIPFLPFSTGNYSAWRDPCIIEDKTGFRMLVTAELEGKPRAFCGCIAELHSSDLQNWSFDQILYMPMDTSKLECPDLFKLDGRWLLLFSNAGVEVRWSENGLDQWKKTVPFYLDNFRYYAAKTLLDDKGRRLCFGFISDRETKNDIGPWKWGGILAFPRQLSLGTGDELCVSAIEELKGMRKKPLNIEIEDSVYTVGKWQLLRNHIQGLSEDDQLGLTALVGQHPESWEVSLQFDLTQSSTAGILFNCQKDYSSGYSLEINKSQAELTLSNFFPLAVSEPSQLQIFKLPEPIKNMVNVKIIFDHTCIEIYINETLGFSSRVYPSPSNGNWWGFYSKCGSIDVKNIEAWDLNSDLVF